MKRATNRRRHHRRGLIASPLLLLLGTVPAARAQDLSPRSYFITPVGTSAITLSTNFNDGHLLFEGTVPITGATGQLGVPAVSYYRALSCFGRSANFTATQPYGVGTFRGQVLGAETVADRSGWLDTVFRFSVNLKGGPAMKLDEARRWRQKTLLGASVKVAAPTGQYQASKLINLGGNRWAFKPEVGLSRRWGNWIVDAYAGAWLFTRNPEFFSRNSYFPGTRAQTQEPIAAFETHLSYDVRPRLWVSLDANFWRGGRTSLDGVENPATLQKSSRVGVTASVPLTRHQSIKIGLADGAYVRFGGDYRIVSLGWQYSWLGKDD